MSFSPANGTRRLAAVLIGIFVSGAAAPAAAEFMPPPENATTEQRQLLRSAFLRLTDTDPANDAAVVATLDRELERLIEPSPIRGMVQLLRAMALHRTDHAKALAALEESVALLPGYSGPLLIGSTIYAFDDQPAKAADYLLRASWIDPEIVAKIGEYELFNLTHRLSARGERIRIADLSERLLDLGWVGERVGSRAALASNAIGLRVEAGDVKGARALISNLVAPGPARRLLIDRRYQPIWPDIERWAGMRLEKIWPLYLANARSRWKATGQSTAARDYFSALELANHDATILWEILPLLSGEIDPKDYDLIYLVAPMARVLARNGKWADVEAMFERTGKAWPLGSDANALNIAANRARYLRYAGKTADGLALIEAALADAVKRGGEVNQDALVGMHKERACMLHELGKGDSAAASIAFVAESGSPTEIADLNLCLERPDAALEALLTGLEQPHWREAVLNFVQPADSPPISSQIGRRDRERSDRLRKDQRLLDRAAQYGRVLPWAPGDGAPAEAAEADSAPEAFST